MADETDTAVHTGQPAAVQTDERRPRPDEPTGPDEAEVLVEDLLVEEISIDGMCGVY